jgi:hypothetical protein
MYLEMIQNIIVGNGWASTEVSDWVGNIGYHIFMTVAITR